MQAKDAIKQIIIRFFHIFPVKKKVVLFNNFYGRGFDENPRAIAEQILRDKTDLKLYWVLSKVNMLAPLPKGIIRLERGSLKYYYFIATSSVWVSNVRLPEYCIKRKKQYYIQTWHASGVPYKMVEYDALDNLSDQYKRMMAHDNMMIDLLLSGSRSNTETICRRAFRYNGEVLEVGDPKNDYIIKADKVKCKNTFKKKFKIAEDKLLIYMPTFRVDYSKKPFDIDLDSVKIALEKSTGKTWKIICKMHPNVEEKNKKIKCSDYLSIDGTDSTQEAILSSDLLITDYSSVMFDALLANIPVFLYVKDYEQYTKHERGFYSKLNELPFPSFKTTKQMVNAINSKQFPTKKQYTSFANRIKLATTGDASKRVAQRIEEKCSE